MRVDSGARWSRGRKSLFSNSLANAAVLTKLGPVCSSRV
jgi:hypothetical protein